ncbi:MAG: ABC transporter ATP-binding protein [Longimicrobiales bacterium]
MAPAESIDPSRHLELHGVATHFSGFDLGPLDLDMALGERWVIAGANGSGKTTTVRIISGRLPDFEGTVTVLGADVRESPVAVRARIGLLPEQRAGFGWMTVREHLDFVSAFHPEWDPDYAARLQAGFHLRDEAKVGTLSKGMRLKLALVAAEAFRPPILLLDEPTSGVDPVAREGLLDLIDEAVPPGGNRLLIFSTHILEDLDRLRPQIAVLAGGRLQRMGAADELLGPDRDDPRRRALIREMHP